jgi:hypothetical protein
MGTPLPGTRPERAAANNRKYACDDNCGHPGHGTVADQAGLGKENLICSADFLGLSDQRWTDFHNMPPHLMTLGDPGEAFGGS